MKLLFLDIDGVLTSNETISRKEFLYTFSASCVWALNRILRDNKVKIILTSSWRTVFDAEKQNQIFRENGIIQLPGGQTNDFGYENRSLEIQDYLSKRKVENYVILDDMKINGFEGHFVLINPSTGLTENDVEKVNRILGNLFK